MQPRCTVLTSKPSQRTLHRCFIKVSSALRGEVGHVTKYIEPVFFNSLRIPWSAVTGAVPGQCAVCFSWSRGRLCALCLSRFATPSLRCQRCALRVPEGVAVCGACIKSPPVFDSALASVDYGHPWDQLIARFKFNAALDLSNTFADLMLRTHSAHLQREQRKQCDNRCDDRCDEQPDDPNAPADLLLPVPLSAQRLRERGYNQAWELARRAARALQIRADAKLLLRVKDTPHQLAFPPASRAANVRGAFAVEPTRWAELRGKRIVVFDDVMTTASTANEIASVLRQAGAARVHIWVIARTPSPGD